MRHTWKTNKGEVLFVDEMKDSHLLNAHRLVNEACVVLSQNVNVAYSMASTFQGEMAQFYADREIGRMEDTSTKVFSIRRVLAEEIKKRNLRPLPIRQEKINPPLMA